jgi:hypothetical protein
VVVVLFGLGLAVLSLADLEEGKRVAKEDDGYGEGYIYNSEAAQQTYQKVTLGGANAADDCDNGEEAVAEPGVHEREEQQEAARVSDAVELTGEATAMGEGGKSAVGFGASSGDSICTQASGGDAGGDLDYTKLDIPADHEGGGEETGAF